MDFAVVFTSVAGLFVLGSLSWAIIPVVERRFGDSAASSLAIGGGLGHIVTAALAFKKGIGFGFGLISVGLLLWAGIMYARFVLRRRDIEPPETPFVQESCASELVLGERTFERVEKKNWRTYLVSEFFCAPTHSSLYQQAWAAGGAYYVIWAIHNEAIVQPNIRISCRREEGKSILNTSVKGALQDDTGPVSVHVTNGMGSSDGFIAISIEMGAALNASGGPNISVTGIGVDFPEASQSSVYAMGTYAWRCKF